MSKHLVAALASAAFLSCEITHAQTAPVEKLPEIDVTAPFASVFGTPPIKQRYQLPQTSESITAAVADRRINIIDPEDTLKYLPSLFLRKRNNGDTQATLATRTSGVNASARSLVYADDLLLSALIANNNTIGAPRWGLVAPEQISRVDVLYGPFSALYPGNSIGGVVQITTRMPDTFEADIKQTEAFQTFKQFGTDKTFRTDNTSAFIGNRNNDVSWLISGNFQNSYSQPLAYITNGTFPAGTLGTFGAVNRLGQPANIVGAGGLLHTQMANIVGKVAWDITPWLTATYSVGYWNNNARSSVQTYLTSTATGAPTFGGVAGFASNNYSLRQEHLSNSLSLKTDTKGTFDWDISVSHYNVLNDLQRSPNGVTAGTGFTTYGRIARLDGTYWTNADIKGIWRPFGYDGPHEISFGAHFDEYVLNNPTYATPNWTGGANSTNSLFTDGKGRTTTTGFFIQDAWKFASDWKLTLGGRLEQWNASDGLNVSASSINAAGNAVGAVFRQQPNQDALRFSPKAAIAYDFAPNWQASVSFGQAYRFPTVAELYQIVSTGATFTTPNANLKPENALSEEFAIERKTADSKFRLSIFNENVDQALISQTNLLNGVATTFFTNVDAIRNTGIELSGQKNNIFVEGLELFGSVTYVDSRIEKNTNFVSATGTTSVGKRVPYVPDWRSTFGATYRPDDHWSFTAAARYSGRQYATVDNSDVIKGVYQGFDSFFVADLRIQYKYNEHATFSFGIDNIGNEQYFLFHPFPGRTFIAEAKATF